MNGIFDYGIIRKSTTFTFLSPRGSSELYTLVFLGLKGQWTGLLFCFVFIFLFFYGCVFVSALLLLFVFVFFVFVMQHSFLCWIPL